ncbi:uncharacterized protein PAC_08154 [Phialocephala subalpina]|uniref:SnoaL-like domain-containing protein n=1 Tax=Phialocephala subalpina TaxID=576137 RepID=A0A1L7WZQ5_9HELO|nr:uncharacterized protein PAC_08154 [Phialocephala subalpina]
MPFQLTPAHIEAIVGPAAYGEWKPFLDALDPNVNWMIGDHVSNEKQRTGTYNVQTWLANVQKPLFQRLTGPVHMKIDHLDVVGSKAIFEASGFATQKNGKPYNNKFCWIMIFNDDTGKVVAIREYINSALLREVFEENEV